jgi:hypothetical protein
MQLSATFTLEKETKNTIRYQEIDGDQPPIMGTAYVQKWALKKLGNGTAPSRITITITVE